MQEIKISRDKKNPTWVWVSDEGINSHSTDKKRILLDIVDDGCICVNVYDKDSYINGKQYTSMAWKYFTVVKEPAYRPFKDGAEFIEFCKTRTDMRVLYKKSNSMYTIVGVDTNDPGSIAYTQLGNKEWLSFKSLYVDYTWLDGSPIGIKEEN